MGKKAVSLGQKIGFFCLRYVKVFSTRYEEIANFKPWESKRNVPNRPLNKIRNEAEDS